ncbi:hypothetical protein [Streptomyces sp. NPDC001811]
MALEASGPGAALWEGLKTIVKRSSSPHGAQNQLDPEALEAVFLSPLHLESAEVVVRRLSDRARSDARLRADLDRWARQALELRPVLKHDALAPEVIKIDPAARPEPGIEAHFVVYGGSRGSVEGNASHLFTSQ